MLSRSHRPPVSSLACSGMPSISRDACSPANEITAVHLIAAPWQQDFVRDAAPRTDARLHLHTASVRNNSFSRNLWYYARASANCGAARRGHRSSRLPHAAEQECISLPDRGHACTIYTRTMFLQNFGFPKVLFNQLVLQRCLRTVDAIACVSNSTLARLEGMEPRLALAEGGCHPQLRRAAASLSPQPARCRIGAANRSCCVSHSTAGTKTSFFFCESSSACCAPERIAPRTRLVIVGIPGPETNAIRRFIAVTGIADRVVLLNGLSDEELQWCYRNCCAPARAVLSSKASVFLLRKRFSQDARVICSDIAAFREVGADRCLYIPLDAQAEQAFCEVVCYCHAPALAAAGRVCRSSPRLSSRNSISSSIVRCFIPHLHATRPHLVPQCLPRRETTPYESVQASGRQTARHLYRSSRHGAHPEAYLRRTRSAAQGIHLHGRRARHHGSSPQCRIGRHLCRLQHHRAGRDTDRLGRPLAGTQSHAARRRPRPHARSIPPQAIRRRTRTSCTAGRSTSRSNCASDSRAAFRGRASSAHIRRPFAISMQKKRSR